MGENSYWHIRYNDDTFKIKYTENKGKGFIYIAILLANPGIPFIVNDLVLYSANIKKFERSFKINMHICGYFNFLMCCDSL